MTSSTLVRMEVNIGWQENWLQYLEYAKWENFYKVIQRAMIACKNSGHNVIDHFPDIRKMVAIGSSTNRPLTDYELTRYACYLIVQNGDPRKEVIAHGQSYFAIQTYRQEIAEKFNQLDEDSQRLVVRGEMKQWNQLLAEAARSAGVITTEEYAIFQNAGYQGLYGGLTVDDIHIRKGLVIRDKILDFMGIEELAANLFRITQTESKLRRENVQGVDSANETHFTVGKTVRQTIKNLGGTMPENLPVPGKGISQLECEQIAAMRRNTRKKPLMLDE